jgi:hypothetical protein
MDPIILRALTLILWITVPLSPIIHWGVVCRRVRREGGRGLIGVLPWRFLGEMHRYKELCRAASDSLNAYYVFVVIHWFNLILGIVVGLGYLQQRNHPLP